MFNGFVCQQIESDEEQQASGIKYPSDPYATSSKAAVIMIVDAHSEVWSSKMSEQAETGIERQNKLAITIFAKLKQEIFPDSVNVQGASSDKTADANQHYIFAPARNHIGGSDDGHGEEDTTALRNKFYHDRPDETGQDHSTKVADIKIAGYSRKLRLVFNFEVVTHDFWKYDGGPLCC